MSFNAIDYFASIGKSPDTPISCTSFPCAIEEDGPLLSAQEIWNEAITDIVLLAPDDHLPDPEHWIICNETINGNPVEFPIIAFRKRIHSGRMDHISELTFFQNGEHIPSNYEVLRTTISGEVSGLIKSWGYLGFKRASVENHSALTGDPLILDIMVVKNTLKEEIPIKFLPVERNNGGINPYTANETIYVIKPAPSMGVCDWSFKPVLLDRYPEADYKGIPLPDSALPFFAFPKNLRLHVGSKAEQPMPVFFTFVFTDQDGKHFYVACLKFFEPLDPKEIETVAKEVWKDDRVIRVPSDKVVFCPKIICVLSRLPFYRAMRRYLRQLYTISLSSSICPLESFITSVIGQIPLPVEGGRPFHVILDASLIASTSKPMAPIVFSLPPSRYFPVMDLDFAGPLRCLSIDTLLTVMALMLREAKMIFVSFSNAMLTETMETLRKLLFPLSWSSCFVSRLPTQLLGLLQAPGGFMIGIHTEKSEIFGSTAPARSEWLSASKKLVRTMHLNYPILQGTYVIDLTCGSISMYNGKYMEQLSNAQQEAISKVLPTNPKLRLKDKLYSMTDRFQIGPQSENFDELDSAFDMQMSMDKMEGARPLEEFPTLLLRDSFMSFMADIIGDYTQYIVPPTDDLSADTYRTLKEEFDIPEYLQEADPTSRTFLEYLVETQMFSVLLQQRSEGTSQALVFFEEAALLQRNLGLSLVTHGAYHGKPVTNVTALPAMMCTLLKAENHWACLTKTMQQQLLERSRKENSNNKHMLTFLSTNSLSPIRSNASHGISHSQHAIQNQKLLDLLAYLDFTHIDSSNDKHEMSQTAYSIARKEIERGENLQIREASLGPLILPGPTINNSVEAPPYDEDRVLYSYHGLWPQLKKDYLNDFKSTTHRQIQLLRTQRLFTLDKVDSSTKLLVRCPSERLTLSLHKSMDEKPQVSQVSKYVMAALLDILSISISLLSLRVRTQARPVEDTLQALGIIAQIECWELSDHINETTWRSILMGCAAGGGDVLRRISALIFKTLQQKLAQPNALTYGQYIKAISAKVAPTSPAMVSGQWMDQFFYLEEVGKHWFMHKAAVALQDASRFSQEPVSRRKKPNWTVEVDSSQLQMIEDRLQLSRSQGAVPMLKSRHISVGFCPILVKSVTSVNAEDISKALQERLDVMYQTAEVVQRRNSSLIKARNSIQAQQITTQAHTNSSQISTPDRLSNMISSVGHEMSNISPMGLMSKLSTQLFHSGIPHSSSSSSSPPLKPLPKQMNQSHSVSPPPAASVGASSFSFSNFMKSRGRNALPAPSAPVPMMNKSVSPVPNLQKSKIEELSARMTLDEVDEELSEDGSSRNSEADDLKIDLAKDMNDINVHAQGIAQMAEDNRTEEQSGSKEAPAIAMPEPDDSVDKRDDKSPIESRELHDMITNCLLNEIKSLNKAIAIHSYSPCICGYTLMDEEVLALWCMGNSIDVHHSISSRVAKSGREVSNEDALKCPHCTMKLMPMLSVNCYQQSPSLSDEISSLWTTSVLLLSPFDLRFELEELILRVGSLASNGCWLHHHDPLVYWNLIWYTTRNSVPHGLHFDVNGDHASVSPLKENPVAFHHSHLQLPVVVAWRPSVAKAKANRVINDIPAYFIEIRDIFPLCTEDELRVLSDSVLSNLDGSLDGMRSAMLHFASCRGVFEDSKLHDASIQPTKYIHELEMLHARTIYTGLLTLSIQFSHFPLFDGGKHDNMFRDYSKESSFDKLFIDAIKCVMSRAELDSLGCKEATLLANCSPGPAIIVRAMRGLLP